MWKIEWIQVKFEPLRPGSMSNLLTCLRSSLPGSSRKGAAELPSSKLARGASSSHSLGRVSDRLLAIRRRTAASISWSKLVNSRLLDSSCAYVRQLQMRISRGLVQRWAHTEAKSLSDVTLRM